MTAMSSSTLPATCGVCGRNGPAEWWVTAPQIDRPSRPGRREPWGTVHIRRDGAATTACGLPSIGWFVFWGRSFNAPGADRCEDCVQAWIDCAGH